jgi:transcriptional regulator GlxA family with amidase domain
MLRRHFFDAFSVATSLALVTHLDPEIFESDPVPSSAPSDRLTPPPRGPIPVAVLVSEGATVIDFAGPWEVFQDTMVPSRGQSHDEQMPFQLYTVADSTEPVRVTGGMRIVPDYTVDDAPAPRVIVVPAMRASERVLAWLRKTSPSTDLTMSVCTGAFVLGRAGLLKGRRATTHHQFQGDLAKAFPDVTVERGRRFVEGGGNVATAGGLTSGIHLALRVVERYFGREVGDATARYMEFDRTIGA